MKTWMLVIVMLLFAMAAQAADLNGYQLVKLAGPEQKAVVKGADGKLQMVGVGAKLGDATITAIADGEMRLERAGEYGVQTLIVHVDADGKQKIDRMEVQPLRATTVRGGVQAK